MTDTKTEKEPVAIKGISIKVGKVDLVLEIEEARQLQGLLDELFGKVVVKEEHHHHHPYWYPSPMWSQQLNSPFRVQDNMVYCSDNTSSTGIIPPSPTTDGEK